MVANTEIKFYVHTNSNAPQLPNTWGSLVGILDACLINGYNAPPISEVAISSNVMTITFGVAHNLLSGQVLRLSGANQSEFNREFRITTIPTLNTVQIVLDNSLPASISGIIFATLPSLGWVKEFSGGGRRAYRSAEISKTERPFLRILDELDPAYGADYAKYAKVGIVSNMSDINSISGLQTPYDLQKPDKNWIGTGSGTATINGWAKWYYSNNEDVYSLSFGDSNGSNSTAKQWLVVGNGEWFYILPSLFNSIYPNTYFFGKLSESTETCYGLSSSLQYDTARNNISSNKKTALASGVAAFLLHNGSSLGVRALGMQSGGNDGPGGSSLYFESLNDQLLVSDVYVSQIHNNNIYRFKMPSFKWVINPYLAAYELKTMQDLSSTYLLKTVCASTGNSGVSGFCAFDLKG